MIIFYCLRCPSCGRWRSCSMESIKKYVFKCHKCNKTRKVKQQKTFGLALDHSGPYACAAHAAQMCAALQVPEGKRGVLSSDFVTYKKR